MYGTIYGDLAGSLYEYSQTRKIETVVPDALITDDSFFSDDTILTMAILEAVLDHKDYAQCLREYIQKFIKEDLKITKPYFEKVFSNNMIHWSMTNSVGTSKGNGAMMRISPIGFLFDSEEDIRREAALATIPSHNSSEAIDSATTIALMIYYFRKGYSKEEVYQMMNLEIQYVPFTRFNTTCSKTIGNCLYSFYYANSFEDAFRKTLWMGGDTDTNSAIVGGLAEAFYGVDSPTKEIVKQKIRPEFVSLLERADQRLLR